MQLETESDVCQQPSDINKQNFHLSCYCICVVYVVLTFIYLFVRSFVYSFVCSFVLSFRSIPFHFVPFCIPFISYPISISFHSIKPNLTIKNVLSTKLNFDICTQHVFCLHISTSFV